MSELMRQEHAYAPAPPALSRQHRRTARRAESHAELTRVLGVHQGRATAQQVDVHAALAGHAMQRAAQVIEHRRVLAGDDAELDAELRRFQGSAFAAILAEQSGLLAVLR
jgi:hypothetical protein